LLERVSPIIFVDGLRVAIPTDKGVLKKCVYTVLGLGVAGKQEVLGLWIEETEGARFWLKVFNDLKARGVHDALIVCGDGLPGLRITTRSGLCLVTQYAPPPSRAKTTKADKAVRWQNSRNESLPDIFAFCELLDERTEKGDDSVLETQLQRAVEYREFAVDSHLRCPSVLPCVAGLFVIVERFKPHQSPSRLDSPIAWLLPVPSSGCRNRRPRSEFVPQVQQSPAKTSSTLPDETKLFHKLSTTYP
jgi:hypothetical protein